MNHAHNEASIAIGCEQLATTIPSHPNHFRLDPSLHTIELTQDAGKWVTKNEEHLKPIQISSPIIRVRGLDEQHLTNRRRESFRNNRPRLLPQMVIHLELVLTL